MAYLAWDTRSDSGPGDARLRAAQQFGTISLQQHMATGQGLDAQWGQWAQHRGHVETSASPYLGEPPPAAKPDQTYRATIISRRVVGDNGWSQQLAASTVYCTLVQAGSGWLVDHVDLSTPGAT